MISVRKKRQKIFKHLQSLEIKIRRPNPIHKVEDLREIRFQNLSLNTFQLATIPKSYMKSSLGLSKYCRKKSMGEDILGTFGICGMNMLSRISKATKVDCLLIPKKISEF